MLSPCYTSTAQASEQPTDKSDPSPVTIGDRSRLPRQQPDQGQGGGMRSLDDWSLRIKGLVRNPR